MGLTPKWIINKDQCVKYNTWKYLESKERSFEGTSLPATEVKEIMLHFLLEVNPSFDDDLLQDVIEMMDMPTSVLEVDCLHLLLIGS